MTNKTVLMIGIAAAVSLAGILVFSPIHAAIATIIDNPQSQCLGGSQVQHWDKIIFVVTRDSSRVLGPNSVGKQFDLIVPSQPGVVYDLENVTLTAIENQINPTHDPHIVHKAVRIEIVDVKYDAASCGTTTIQGPQGPPGTSVTVAPEQPGPNCANGGVKLTSASGINYVCNGGSSISLTLNPTISQNPVTAGILVTLSANPTGGTPPISYNWSVTLRPAASAAALSSPSAQNPTFTPDVAGNYQFSVTATDSLSISSIPMSVTLTVDAPQTAPP